jgi:hypothetical protein
MTYLPTLLNSCVETSEERYAQRPGDIQRLSVDIDDEDLCEFSHTWVQRYRRWLEISNSTLATSTSSVPNRGASYSRTCAETWNVRNVSCWQRLVNQPR